VGGGGGGAAIVLFVVKLIAKRKEHIPGSVVAANGEKDSKNGQYCFIFF
jgi:hypothetical protein